MLKSCSKTLLYCKEPVSYQTMDCSYTVSLIAQERVEKCDVNGEISMYLHKNCRGDNNISVCLHC